MTDKDSTRTISLEDALSMALEQSVASKTARLERSQGTQAVAEGASYMLPSIQSRSSTQASTVDSLGEGPWSTSIILSQPVADAQALLGVVGGFTQRGLHRASSRKILAQLVLDVKTAYYNLAKAQALVRSAQEAVKLASSSLDLASRLYQVGSVEKSEKLRAEVNLLGAETQLASAKSNLATARVHLANLIGIEPLTPLESDPLPQVPEPKDSSSRVLAEEMMRNNPDLRLTYRKTRAANLGAASAWAGVLPSLSFELSKTSAGEEVFASPSQLADAPTSYGLSLTMPIADVANRTLGISRAHLERKQASLELTSNRLSAKEELDRLIWQQETAYKRWQTASKSVELSTEVYKIYSKRYQLGDISLTDLIQAETDLAQAEKNLVEAKADYWSAQAQLDYVLGRSLEE